MFCTICGAYNENADVACSSCGAPLRPYDDPSGIGSDYADARFDSSRDGLTEPAAAFGHMLSPHADVDKTEEKSDAQDGCFPSDVNGQNGAFVLRKDPEGSSPPVESAKRETPELTDAANVSRKKAIAPIAVGAMVLAALLAVVLLPRFGLPALSSGSFGHNPGAEQDDASGSEEATPPFEGVDFQVPFDLSDLLTGSPEQTAETIGDLCEYLQIEYYDQYAYTANWDMARYFESRPSADEEYDDGAAWRIAIDGSDGNDHLRIENLEAGDAVGAVDFVGRFQRKPFIEGETYTAALTCDEAAQIVSSIYDYDCIVLCKEEYGRSEPYDLQDLDSWIEGYATKGDTVARIQVHHDTIRPKRNYEIEVHVLSMPPQDGSEPTFNQEQGQEYYDYCMYLCLDDALSNKCADSYVVAPNAQATQDSSAEHHVVVYHHGAEEEYNFTTDSLESSFAMPFDLGYLVTASRQDVLSAIEGLCRPFDGEKLYSNDSPHASAMGYTANSTNNGWWELYLYRAKTDSESINQTVSPSDIEDGAEVCEAHLTAYVAASDPTCEDVAELVSDAYDYDRIVLYSYYGSHEHIAGYAATDDTIALIVGEAITASTSTIGSYQLEIEVCDETSERGWGWNKYWESANIAFDEDPPEGLRDSFIG